ncbi:MAG TPA: hypothetical protein H9971_07180 [Candidatus Dorea merdavium]|nr:hypothetical protein [Candidatus Dorea merdavium]
MKKIEVRYLSQEDVISLNIGWGDVIDCVARACVEQAQGTVECPPKRGIHTREDAFIHEMPVWIKGMDACGIKWVSGYPNNYRHDLPQILGVQVMNDPETGVPTCIMDCRWLTAVRTAAATAITMKYCARKDSRKICLVGAGVQGRMHLLAIKHVLPLLDTCHIVELKPDVLDTYVREMPDRSKCDVIPFSSVEDAAKDVDIIMTCTQKLHHPIIPEHVFQAGMTGGGLEAGRAWPAELLHGVDKVITDDLEQTMSYGTTGAFAGGLPKFYCQLGELVEGKPGRENNTERILAFNIGFAAEDISLGQLIATKAEKLNVGRRLPLMEQDL